LPSCRYFIPIRLPVFAFSRREPDKTGGEQDRQFPICGAACGPRPPTLDFGRGDKTLARADMDNGKSAQMPVPIAP
jgi:hypothetical protein